MQCMLYNQGSNSDLLVCYLFIPKQAQPEIATGYKVILLLAMHCQPDKHNNDNIHDGNVMK